MPHGPELSIIIPTLHYVHVDRVVAALLASTVPGSEVLVSDSHEGAWKDAVQREAARVPGSRVIYLQRERDTLWRSRALNAALEAATGRIVVLLGGDFTPGPDFVRAHLAFHERHPEREAVAIGPGRFIAGQSSGALIQWLEESGRLFGTRFAEGDAEGFFYAGNASLKRDFLNQVGGFDEDFRYDSVDDFELGVRLRRAGMRSYHLPEAVAMHEHAEEVTLAEHEYKMRITGESIAIFERKHAGPFEWSAICARSPFALRIDAVFWRTLYALTWRRAYLHRYYLSRREAAFVEGWRLGRRLPA